MGTTAPSSYRHAAGTGSCLVGQPRGRSCISVPWNWAFYRDLPPQTGGSIACIRYSVAAIAVAIGSSWPARQPSPQKSPSPEPAIVSSVVQTIDRVPRRRDQRSHLVSHCDHLCRAHPVAIGVAITDRRAGVRATVDAAPLPAAHGRALALRSPPGLGQTARGRPQPQRWVHEIVRRLFHLPHPG
jgi:hypothetical protein